MHAGGHDTVDMEGSNRVANVGCMEHSLDQQRPVLLLLQQEWAWKTKITCIRVRDFQSWKQAVEADKKTVDNTIGLSVLQAYVKLLNFCLVVCWKMHAYMYSVVCL